MMSLKFKITLIFIAFFWSFSYSQENADDYFYDFSEGFKYFDIGNVDKSEEFLQAALKENPNSAATNYLLAKIYVAKSDYLSALGYAQKAVDLQSSNKWYKFLLIDILNFTGQTEKVKDYYAEILENTSDLDDYYTALNYFLSVSDFTDVKHWSYKGLQKFNNDYNLFLFFLESLYNLNDTTGLISALSDFTDFYNENQNAYKVAADYSYRVDYVDTAIIYLRKVIDNYDDDAQVNLFLSKCFFRLNNVDSAVFYFKNALNFPENEKYFSTFLEENKKYLIFRDLDTNFNFILKSVYLIDSSSFLINRAVADVYYANNFFYDAIFHYEKTVSLNPTLTNELNLLLNLYLRFSEWEKLKKLSEKAMIYYPVQPYYFLYKAIAELNLSDYSQAFDDLTFGKNLLFDEDTLLFSYFDFYFSQYYHFTGDKDNENLYLTSALNNVKSNCQIISHFCLYFAKHDYNLDLAVKLMGNCLVSNLDTIKPGFAYVYAYVLYKYEDYGSAADYIDIAINKAKLPDFLYYHLKYKILLKTGKTDEANKFLNLYYKYGGR